MSKKSQSSVDGRAQELDTIAAVLPMERRDELTNQDVETLKHLVERGMGDNTWRALTSDLTYLEAWTIGALAGARSAALKIHRPSPLGSAAPRGRSGSRDARRRRRKSSGHGFLNPSDCMRRRLANWSTLTKWRGLDGAFASPTLKSAIRLAIRAVPRQRRRKSAKAVTGDVPAKLLTTCATDSLRNLRDRAILMVAFASGGRSEIAGLRREQLTVEMPIPVENGAPSPPSPSILAAPRPAMVSRTLSSI